MSGRGKMIFTEEKIVVNKKKGKIEKGATKPKEEKTITNWEFALSREDGHLIVDDMEGVCFRVPFGKTDCLIAVFPEDATSCTVYWNDKVVIENAKSFRFCDKEDMAAALALLEFVV